MKQYIKRGILNGLIVSGKEMLEESIRKKNRRDWFEE